jgi:hypothetical protein
MSLGWGFRGTRTDNMRRLAMVSCLLLALFHCILNSDNETTKTFHYRLLASESNVQPRQLSHEPVRLEVTATEVTFTNGYVIATFDRTAPALRHLAGGK